MGIELLFIAMTLLWLAIFLYLLILHLQQRKIARAAFELHDSLREKPER